MVSYSRSLKRALFGALVVLLVSPAIQSRLKPIDIPELKGYFEPAPHPDLSWHSLLDNSYQPALERYVEDRIGFRAFLIRLRNQLGYSFFGLVRANNVLIGEDNVLFEEGGIKGFLGQDRRDDAEIRANVRKLKAVQDTLAGRGVLLVFAIAPDKANFYSNRIPKQFKNLPRTESNYTAYAKQMRAKGINMIDLAQLFRVWKDTCSYPLFPRGGIHWSGYGITLAADTLFRYIERRAKLDLPDFSVDGCELSDEARVTDDDVAQAMNLLWTPTPYRMAYPRVTFHKLRPDQRKPSLLLVGDSFGWGLINFYPYFPTLFENKFQYWYYNKQVQWGEPATGKPGNHDVAALDLRQEMLAHDVVLLLFDQHNLAAMDYGFAAAAYSIFCPITPAEQTTIQVLEQELKQSSVLRDSLWQRTHRTGRSYNELLREEAVKEYELRRP